MSELAPEGTAPRKRLWRLPLLALLGGLAGCSPRLLVETLFLGDNFVLTRDVAYGEGAARRLDVYRPRRAERRAPVVVFLYGGRWQSGAKRDYRLLADALTRRGFLVVIPDYRLYPAVRFPGWVEDAARAVAWAREHAASYDGDTTRLFVIGHSAGAHTATLLALDEHYLRDARLPPGAVRGFVSLAGPVDTSWTDADVQALMGPPEGWPATYPRNHIDGTEPPLLLLHGGGDESVAPLNSTRLAARIRDRGGCARAVVYPRVGHVELVVALALPRLGIAPVLNDVAAFIHDPDLCRSG
jgi:acetyl esterase/lipase